MNHGGPMKQVSSTFALATRVHTPYIMKTALRFVYDYSHGLNMYNPVWDMKIAIARGTSAIRWPVQNKAMV